MADQPWTDDACSLVDAFRAGERSPLEELEATHPRACRVVECRFFGGMTVDETAVAVGASERSVKRDWALAQAWLHRAMDPEERADSGDA